jgi:hypothetical protein
VIEVTVCKDRCEEPFSLTKKKPRIPPLNKVHASADKFDRFVGIPRSSDGKNFAELA